MAASELTAILEQIRERSAAALEFPASGFAEDSIRACTLSAHDVPRLLVAVEAVLDQADDMDKDAAERYQRAAQLGDPRMAVDYDTEARQLSYCAAKVREAIRAALAGEAGDGA